MTQSKMHLMWLGSASGAALCLIATYFLAVGALSRPAQATDPTEACGRYSDARLSSLPAKCLSFWLTGPGERPQPLYVEMEEIVKE